MNKPKTDKARKIQEKIAVINTSLKIVNTKLGLQVRQTSMHVNEYTIYKVHSNSQGFLVENILFSGKPEQALEYIKGFTDSMLIFSNITYRV
jgi:hypothetical protein